MPCSRCGCRTRRADSDDEPGVSVDDDQVIGRVAVVLISGWHQGAVHDQHSVPAEPLALLQSQREPEVVDDAIRCRRRDTEERAGLPQRQVRPPVRSNQQDPVLQRQAPWPSLADGVYALAL